MNEINPKYENTRKIHRLLTNRNPGFLYKVLLNTISMFDEHFYSGSHLEGVVCKWILDIVILINIFSEHHHYHHIVVGHTFYT